MSHSFPELPIGRSSEPTRFGSAWRGASTARLLAAAAAVVVIGSLPAFARTFLTDMDFYAHVADKLLNGGVLYKDAIDTKPPGIFIHYAAIFRLFGENNVAAVKAVTVALVALSALGAAGIWRELFGRRDAAFAALVFALASVCGWGGDFLSSNTEVLANVFILSGVYALWAGRFGWHPREPIAAGLLFGIAFLYRFQSAAVIAAYAAHLLLEQRSVRAVVVRLSWIAAGFAAPPAAVVLWYVAHGQVGVLADFIRYDYFYLRGGGVYWPALAGQTAIVVVSQVQILLLAGWQAARVVRHRPASGVEPGDRFLVLWCGFSCLAFAAGGRFFAHYYVQALPPAALLAARRLTEPRDAADAPTGAAAWYVRRAPGLIAVQAAVFVVVNASVFWWTREPVNPYPELVRFARSHTTKRDPIYVWTSRTHILFDMDRIYATRFISNDFLVGRMYGTRHRLRSATADSARVAAVPELWPLLMDDLERNPPALIVDDIKARSAFTLDHYPELAAFVARRYAPCRDIDGFCVYVRNGELK